MGVVKKKKTYFGFQLYLAELRDLRTLENAACFFLFRGKSVAVVGEPEKLNGLGHEPYNPPKFNKKGREKLAFFLKHKDSIKWSSICAIGSKLPLFPYNRG